LNVNADFSIVKHLAGTDIRINSEQIGGRRSGRVKTPPDDQ
jgi:hypothetical protein